VSQSLLHQVRVRTHRRGGACGAPGVSIPSSSGPRSNEGAGARWSGRLVSIPSSSGPRSNAVIQPSSNLSGRSQSLLHQVRVRTTMSEPQPENKCLNPFFIRSAFELAALTEEVWAVEVSIPSSSGPRSNFLRVRSAPLRRLNPFFIRSAFERKDVRGDPRSNGSQSLLHQVRVRTCRVVRTPQGRRVSIPSSSGPRSNLQGL